MQKSTLSVTIVTKKKKERKKLRLKFWGVYKSWTMEDNESLKNSEELVELLPYSDGA